MTSDAYDGRYHQGSVPVLEAKNAQGAADDAKVLLTASSRLKSTFRKRATPRRGEVRPPEPGIHPCVQNPWPRMISRVPPRRPRAVEELPRVPRCLKHLPSDAVNGARRRGRKRRSICLRCHERHQLLTSLDASRNPGCCARSNQPQTAAPGAAAVARCGSLPRFAVLRLMRLRRNSR